MYEKLVVVTRKTRLQELIARFNTRMQAKFFIEHSGGNFQEYDEEDRNYEAALDEIRKQSKLGLKIQFIERALLPTYTFVKSDLVLVLGQDGLVANAAKYVNEQPIIGVNPDPIRYDGILVPILPSQVGRYLCDVMEETAARRSVTLAEVELQDGQRLLAFNDFYIGAKTHVSARYRLQYHNQSEQQSSSGVVVSTGAGSTGWLSSIFNMASSVTAFTGGRTSNRIQMRWDEQSLMFVVREPFVSKHSSADLVAGYIKSGEELIIESTMTGEGTIFSDGVEADFISFNAGSIARIRKARQQAVLVVPQSSTEGKKDRLAPEVKAQNIPVADGVIYR
jgi:NAD kinase